jgi:hypothetical protein
MSINRIGAQLVKATKAPANLIMKELDFHAPRNKMKPRAVRANKFVCQKLIKT